MWIKEVQKLVGEVNNILERDMVLGDISIDTSRKCRKVLKTINGILSLAATTEFEIWSGRELRPTAKAQNVDDNTSGV